MTHSTNDHTDRDERDGATVCGDVEGESASGNVDGASAEPTAPAGEAAVASTDTIGVIEAQKRAQKAAKELLEHEFEGVIRVEPMDDCWRTVVETLERRSVPDTQDIIGRYEITLDATGTVTGYELLDRYRRGETKDCQRTE